MSRSKPRVLTSCATTWSYRLLRIDYPPVFASSFRRGQQRRSLPHSVCFCPYHPPPRSARDRLLSLPGNRTAPLHAHESSHVANFLSTGSSSSGGTDARPSYPLSRGKQTWLRRP